jgi:hypothetical protein
VSWESDGLRGAHSAQLQARPCPQRPTRAQKAALGSWGTVSSALRPPSRGCRLTHWARRPPWETVIMILSEKLSDSTSVGTLLIVPTVLFDLAGNGSARTESPSIVIELLEMQTGEAELGVLDHFSQQAHHQLKSEASVCSRLS